MTYSETFYNYDELLPRLRKMTDEFTEAACSLTSQEWLDILSQAAVEAGKETFRTKVRALSEGGKIVREVWQRYSREGVKASLQKDAVKFVEAIGQIPDCISETIVNFVLLSRSERAKAMAAMVLTLLIFYATAGGWDLEGGLPDTDLLLGIGNHRNIFFHSVLIGFGVEFCLRLAVLFIKRFGDRLPINHDPVWDEVRDFIIQNQNLALAALWAGLGAHLIKVPVYLEEPLNLILGSRDTIRWLFISCCLE